MCTPLTWSASGRTRARDTPSEVRSARARAKVGLEVPLLTWSALARARARGSPADLVCSN